MKPKSACLSDIKLEPVSGLLRIDNIPIFRFLRKGEVLYIQFMDGNKPRADWRGTNLVEIPMHDFINCVQNAGDQFEG